MIKKFLLIPIGWLLVATLLLSLVLAGSGLTYRAWKQSDIRTSTAITSENGIESLERIELNGSVQWIYIRGQDRANPVLLFLHGGPGLTEMWGARTFGLNVEKHFTVVHWDQRGAGKSAREDYELTTLTVETYVDDTLALVKHLRDRFEQKRIYLVGHSWGTVPGVMAIRAHPEFFHAYVGVSQMVNLLEMETIGLRYARERAEADGNTKAIAALKELQPPYLEENMADIGIQRRWLAYYGGAMRNISLIEGLHTLLTSPEYSLSDIVGLLNMGTTAKHIWPQLADLDFFEQAQELKVPVYFFTGRYDYQTPFEITERYFDLLEAPHKELIWFDNSAHVIVFSDPDYYQKMMIEKVLAGPQPDQELIPAMSQ